jgi:potassium-transporting ATPase KdpC subunit
MKQFLSEIRRAVAATLILAVVCCGIYPFAVFAVAQIVFQDKANGSLIFDARGTIRGSRLIGQPFTGKKYFHSRPSAAGTGYDATSSGGSNLGPTSQKLRDAINDRIATFRADNNLKDTQAVPADAITASASGLDPHISIANAEAQAPRVAKARGMDEQKVLEIMRQNIQGRDFAIFGMPGVNVLILNLALDSLEAIYGR